MDEECKSATETSHYGNIMSGTLVNPTSEKPKIGRGANPGESKLRIGHVSVDK